MSDKLDRHQPGAGEPTGECLGAESADPAGSHETEGAPEQAGRLNVELFADAYVQQFAHFVDRVGSDASPSVTGNDARVALEIALAAAQSVRTGAPLALAGTVRS